MTYLTKRILIATLEGCQVCEALKQELFKAQISFDELVCSDVNNNRQCDSLEKITSCNMYPIVMIDNSIIFTTTDDYDKLGKIHSYLHHKIIYCHSINNLLDLVKKYLHLK